MEGGDTGGSIGIGKRRVEREIVALIENLTLQSALTRENKVKSLIRRRQEKREEIKSKKSPILNQDTLKPGDAVPRIFSTQKPISSGQKFLGDKEKRILLTSNRAFNKQPNIISGLYRNKFIPHTSEQLKTIKMRKFLDYDRIVTEQTPALKMFLMKRMKKPSLKKPIYSGKRSEELFSNYQIDHNEFYRNNKTEMRTMARTRFKTESTLLRASVQNPSKLLVYSRRKTQGRQVAQKGEISHLYTQV